MDGYIPFSKLNCIVVVNMSPLHKKRLVKSLLVSLHLCNPKESFERFPKTSEKMQKEELITV